MLETLGELRAPFDEVIDKLNHVKIPICSIDIPSGSYIKISQNCLFINMKFIQFKAGV